MGFGPCVFLRLVRQDALAEKLTTKRVVDLCESWVVLLQACPHPYNFFPCHRWFWLCEVFCCAFDRVCPHLKKIYM